MRVVEGVSYSRTQDRGKGDSSHEILPKSTAAGREEEKGEWEEARLGEQRGGILCRPACYTIQKENVCPDDHMESKERYKVK